MSVNHNEPPRCVLRAVDLDGTLINSDRLLESLFIPLKNQVLYVLLLPFWLMAGCLVLCHERVE